MNVLVINAGSSSLKYQLIDVGAGEVIAKGLCERVGTDDGIFKHSTMGKETVENLPIPDHDFAVGLVLNALTEGEGKAIDSLEQIDAVGHRVVQGGSYFDRSVIVDEEVIVKIDELAQLSPLHNKAAIQGIRGCMSHMPDTPMVTVFDSAFFASLPEAARNYPLPLELCEKHAIKRYGAHGTSHRYISQLAAEKLGKSLDELQLITCHLGNGCSITAIDHGKVADTSMGLTPLDGLMMGTRCGAVDPAIVTYLMDKEGFTPQQMDDIMNKQSGLLGVSGASNDLRTVEGLASQGDERAKLALEMFARSIKKHIGQYLALMGGVDCIVLAGGIGENSALVRSMALSGLEKLGIVLDQAANEDGSGERVISTPDSKVSIMVIPTNEEIAIARDTAALVS